jgi:hypothetical protein
MTPGKPVAVISWNEVEGRRRVRDVLQVLVGEEHAGTVAKDGDRWQAEWFAEPGAMRLQKTRHASAEEGVATVLASGWAYKLGVRDSSDVRWSQAARQIADHGKRRITPRGQATMPTSARPLAALPDSNYPRPGHCAT